MIGGVMPMGTPLDRKVRLGGRAGRMWWITVLVCMLFMPSGIEGVPLTGSEAEYRPYCTYQLADAMTVLCLFWELTGCGRDWEDRVAMVRLGMLTFLAPSFMDTSEYSNRVIDEYEAMTIQQWYDEEDDRMEQETIWGRYLRDDD